MNLKCITCGELFEVFNLPVHRTIKVQPLKLQSNFKLFHFIRGVVQRAYFKILVTRSQTKLYLNAHDVSKTVILKFQERNYSRVFICTSVISISCATNFMTHSQKTLYFYMIQKLEFAPQSLELKYLMSTTITYYYIKEAIKSLQFRNVHCKALCVIF